MGIAIWAGILLPVRAEEPINLFSAAPASATSRKTTEKNQTVPLDIQFEALTSGLVTAGTWIRCEPQPGLFFTAQVSRIDVDVNGTLSLLAPVEGHAYAFLSLSVSDNQALGEIRLPDEQLRYQIQFDAPQNRHVSGARTDADMDELPPGPALIPPVSAHAKAVSTPLPAGAAAPTQIDVMIVYTPAAASVAGGTAGINNTIAQAMVRAQDSMDNSLIPVTFRLVHSAQISYTESGNSLTDLERLQKTADGYMDEVHVWRNRYGADLVCLLASVSDTGGLGYMLDTSSGLPAWAFSLCRVQQSASTYTVIHEMGHNLGAHHHKKQKTQPGPNTKLYSYAAGWRWTGTDAKRYCSVMTYEQGSEFADGKSHVRVGHFSTPRVKYMGVASGHKTDGDNARCLTNTREVVANYRKPVQSFQLSATSLDDRVMLRWSDPLKCGFSTNIVLIRCGTSSYPAATDQGSLVYQGTADHFLHTNVLSGLPHFYTLWASQDGITFVEP